MSGSEKTTLLNLIGGLDNPTSGKIVIDNVNFSEMTDKEGSAFRNKNIGYIFQMFYLEPSFTAYENVSIPLIINGKKKKEYDVRVHELLKKVSLDDKANKLVSNLSGGEKQRVCIARALADEPTGSLDSQNGEIVLEYLKYMNFEESNRVGKLLDMCDLSRYYIKIDPGLSIFQYALFGVSIFILFISILNLLHIILYIEETQIRFLDMCQAIGLEKKNEDYTH